MLFAVRFTDVADALPIRKAHHDAHMAWLAENASAIVAAGPLRSGSADSTPVGALWIIQAEDFAAAQALIANDPFMKNGLRASTEILQWSKGFPQTPSQI